MDDPINKLAPRQTRFTGKVLLVITKSNWGGAQWYVYTLAARLKADGADVVVALGGLVNRVPIRGCWTSCYGPLAFARYDS